MVAEGEPLLMSGPNPEPKNSPHADLENRARALVAAWGGTVKEFVLAHYAEIVQVREDCWQHESGIDGNGLHDKGDALLTV